MHQRPVNRIPVLGSSADLCAILDSGPVASVVISSDKIPQDRLAHVVSLCQARDIPVLLAHLALEPLGASRAGGGPAQTPLPAPTGLISTDGNEDQDERASAPVVEDGSSVVFRQGSR